MSGDLKIRAIEWFKTEGYGLEFEVAETLLQLGYQPALGSYVERASGTAAEVDVLATKCLPQKLLKVQATLLIECKYSADRPWFLLGAKETREGAGVPVYVPRSPSVKGHPAVVARAKKGQPRATTHSVVFSHGVVKATLHKREDKGRDVAFEAMRKAAEQAWALADRPSATKDAGDLGSKLVLPIVVVKGILMRARPGATPSDASFEEVPFGHALYNGTLRPTRVDVVTSAGLPAYMDMLEKRLEKWAMTAAIEKASKVNLLKVKPALQPGNPTSVLAPTIS